MNSFIVGVIYGGWLICWIPLVYWLIRQRRDPENVVVTRNPPDWLKSVSCSPQIARILSGEGNIANEVHVPQSRRHAELAQ